MVVSQELTYGPFHEPVLSILRHHMLFL